MTAVEGDAGGTVTGDVGPFITVAAAAAPSSDACLSIYAGDGECSENEGSSGTHSKAETWDLRLERHLRA